MNQAIINDKLTHIGEIVSLQNRSKETIFVTGRCVYCGMKVHSKLARTDPMFIPHFSHDIQSDCKAGTAGDWWREDWLSKLGSTVAHSYNNYVYDYANETTLIDTIFGNNKTQLEKTISNKGEKNLLLVVYGHKFCTHIRCDWHILNKWQKLNSWETRAKAESSFKKLINFNLENVSFAIDTDICKQGGHKDNWKDYLMFTFNSKHPNELYIITREKCLELIKK